MYNLTVASGLIPVTKPKVEKFNPQDLLHFLIKELEKEASMLKNDSCEGADISSNINMSIEDDLLSVFFIKDEEDIKTVLDLAGKGGIL